MLVFVKPVVIAIVVGLAGCNKRDPSPADTMPEVGNKEISLVFEAIKIMSPTQIRSEGSRIDVVLNEKTLTEKIYMTAARSICTDQILKGISFEKVGEIRIWNSGKYQGWAMLLPAKQCNEYADSKNGDEILQTLKRKLTSKDIGSF